MSFWEIEMDSKNLELITNLVALLFSAGIEMARAANMNQEEARERWEKSWAEVAAKDPASHPHPDFG